MSLSLPHIACCVDRSESADLAVAEARRLRRLAPGRLSLVHVAPPREVLAGGLTDWEIDADDPLGPPRRWLEEVTSAIDGAEPVLLCGDPPGEVVTAWLGEAGVDLIVAAAHRSRVQRALLGSFARHLAYESPSHVLIARGQGPGDEGVPRRVGCCVDGSEGAARAVALTQELADSMPARVSLVHVIAPPAATPRRLVARLLPVPRSRRRAADDLLRQQVERFPGAEPVLLTGAPGPEVCAWAAQVEADMLVVGPRSGRHGGLGGFASAVVASAPCGVLLARPEA